ncbi:DinB family protein [Gracilibacillus suaedae]|uniref:DinB family protein n=1 Tax=Gracilibacillus suaedae TaxID=2820273 RepID=UPI001ABEDBB3|nr:DinB family protein [Gracilibacillus suaedae]
MTNSQVIKIYDYHVWANKKIFQHLKQLPDEILNGKVKSVFTSISEVLTHLYATDITWLEVMKGSNFHTIIKKVEHQKSQASQASIVDLEELYDQLSTAYYKFFNIHKNPEHSITTEHPQHGVCEFTLVDLVHHVVNHGTYHRGNLTAMLHQQGERGVPTDYVFFLFK